MNRDNTSESEVLYLVPDSCGPGKKLVRRPRPPLTSLPLDDDFDAITYDPTIMPEKDSQRPSRHTTVLPDQFDPGTATTSHNEWIEKRRRDTMHQSREGTSVRRDHDSGGGRRVMHNSVHGFDDHGQYKQYMEEMERMFGESLDLKVSVRRWGPADSSSDRFSTANERSRIARGSKPGKAGPPPGQEYEIIHHRVIEDGPEKSVTISTWREQVAQETSNEVEMSVYYVGVEDHAPVASELDQSLGKLGPAEIKSSSSSIKPLDKRLGKYDRTYSASSSQTRLNSTHNASFDLYRRGRGERDDYRPQTPNKPMSPEFLHGHLPRTSTPIKGNQFSRNSWRVDDTDTSRRGRRGVGVLSDRTPTSSPFHATQSGSTITSIRRISDSGIEQVLASCEPPLIHIRSTLACLGIVNEEHLKALAKMKEETRDREIKEAALRQSVTVLEWAILMDRLLNLWPRNERSGDKARKV